ncbi:MAG: hypothetical protein COV69_02865 [Parcubacteria group bacterium CG11_big_fil_rev_8_21_14_0_20_39_14]|nr:MAG: hypothetical protein COV69_02865 [Parcubacteria group bacterium CG11_big_fil_rev_8_21_14_0_20_39_14]PIS35602.1 MAG: hypothetical protein COT36_01480 [Parcubacteria group bacterium CG08_land_8_20_14_0_20_38_56]
MTGIILALYSEVDILGMLNSLITNQALEDFINSVELSLEDRDFLLSKLPELDREDRIKLFDTIGDIAFLDGQEREAIKKFRKFQGE